MSKVFVLLLFISCSQESKQPVVKAVSKVLNVNSGDLVIIQPFASFSQKEAEALYNELTKVYPNCKLNPSISFPVSSYYSPRNRHRADNVIQWLSAKAKPGEIFIGITSKDISTTKGDKHDWGVMGLGYRPGNACIASNYRLKNKKTFFKIMIHELGHTTGLPHCPDPFCYMQDAKGGDPTGKENGFCAKCSQHLRKKGWKV